MQTKPEKRRRHATLRWAVRISLPVLLSVTAICFMGCAREAESDDPNVLRVVVQPWMFKKFPLREAAEKFETDHPGKKVKYLKSPGDINTMIFDWERGKTRVDLVITDSFTVMQYIKGEYILPLDDMFDADMPREDFISCFLGDFLYEGKVWGLPFFGEVVMMGFRRDILKEEGYVNEDGTVRLPKTYGEIAEYGRKLTRKEGRQVTRYGISIPWDDLRTYLFLTALASSRGAPKLDDTGNFNLLADEYVDSLQWVCDLVKENVIDPSGVFTSKGVIDSMNRGSTVLAISFASWTMQGEDFMGDKLGLEVLPGSLENGTTVSTAAYSIIKHGRTELAKAFLKEQVQAEYFQNFCASNFKKCPTRRSFYKDLEQPYWPKILKIAEASEPFPRYVDTTKMGYVVSQYAQEAWLGNLKPKEALRKAYDEIADTEKYKR